MDSAPFVRYRAQLAALACEQAARAALHRAGHLWREQGTPLHWTAIFGRFYPGDSPYAVQVFEARDGGGQRIARVEAFDAAPGNGSNDEFWTTDAVIGALRVTTIAADAGLATLASVLDGGVGATVVRYHPGLRCTVRSVRNGREMFGKVFCDDRGRELCEDYQRLWRASSDGELSFAVARPIGWDAASRTLWQVALPGYSVRPRLASDQGVAFARRMGEALGSLAQSQVIVRHVFRAGDQMERAERHAADLARRVPELAADVQMLMTRLRGSRALVERRMPRPIHGAPIATHWLAAGGRLGLVDFDRFAGGDPELDVGILLADLDFERLSIGTARAVADAIGGGWTAKAGPLDHDLVEFYRGHRHLDKAFRRACAIRPDGDRRASASLRRSIELLAPACSPKAEV